MTAAAEIVIPTRSRCRGRHATVIKHKQTALGGRKESNLLNDTLRRKLELKPKLTAVYRKVQRIYINNALKYTSIYLHIWQRWACLLKEQTSIIVYSLPTKENKLPFSVCRKQTKVCHFRWRFPLVSFSVYMKPRRFSLIRLPFAHRANGSSSFVQNSSFVRLFTEEQTQTQTE